MLEQVACHISSSSSIPSATFPFRGKRYGRGGDIVFVYFLMVWGRFRFTIIIHLSLWLKRLGFEWIFNSDMKTQTRRGEVLVFVVGLCFVGGFFKAQQKPLH